MWKFVTRGFRETLERCTCRTNVYSHTSQNNNSNSEVKQSLTCQQKLLIPSISAFNKRFCGSAKISGTKGNNYEWKWNAKHIWFEAVGWSSALALGWVVCQTLCSRNIIQLFEKEQSNNLKNKLSQFSETHLSRLFGSIRNFEPNIFPVVHCAGKEVHEVHEGIETGCISNKPFGPVTIEEAVKKATDDFGNTHKLIMGEFQLHSGIKALEEKRYKDAVLHFTAGADLSSRESMFNLGVCYELGLGTLVDQTKAAKYYSDAAEQGHAGAMYNLGVFHAQGRGGLSIDVSRARNYFVKAAELGQIQAQHALRLEMEYQQKLNNDALVFQNTHANVAHHVKNVHVRKQISGKSINFQKMYVEDEKSRSESFAESSKMKTPTEIFLDYLGLSEPNLIPVTVVTNKCRVPC